MTALSNDDNTLERLTRIETQVAQIYDVLIKGELMQRVMRLEFQMGIAKWVGGLLQAVALLLIAYLLRR